MPLFNGEKSYDLVKRENIKSELVQDKFNPDIPSLLLFYNPGCPACVATKPHWDSLTNTIKRAFERSKINLFNISEYDLSDPSNEKLATLFEIQYIPTIIMMESSKKPMAKIEKIEGMADKERINKFIKDSFKKFMEA